MLAQQEGFITKIPGQATLESYGSARLRYDSCDMRSICWHTIKVTGVLPFWQKEDFSYLITNVPWHMEEKPTPRFWLIR
eukprot:10996454-Ditylum_brightwellii.AAC.1